MFRSDNSSHSWNAMFGQMYGAYYPKQCPGGSSGGSAVATDLGLAWATLGTEVGCPRTFGTRTQDAGSHYVLTCVKSDLLTLFLDFRQYRES